MNKPQSDDISSIGTGLNHCQLAIRESCNRYNRVFLLIILKHCGNGLCVTKTVQSMVSAMCNYLISMCNFYAVFHYEKDYRIPTN